MQRRFWLLRTNFPGVRRARSVRFGSAASGLLAAFTPLMGDVLVFSIHGYNPELSISTEPFFPFTLLLRAHEFALSRVRAITVTCGHSHQFFFPSEIVDCCGHKLRGVPISVSSHFFCLFSLQGSAARPLWSPASCVRLLILKTDVR